MAKHGENRMNDAAIHRTGHSHEMRGVRTVEHFFTVPLDHTAPQVHTVPQNRPQDQTAPRVPVGETLEIFAREYVSANHSDAEVVALPWLLFLQGGPGGKGNRVVELSGWMKEAARHYRILMLDQRGTGRSAYIGPSTLPLRGEPTKQAEYLAHFRADSIVRDAEMIRRSLSGAPWTILGQSFGGFCALTYLSFAPEGLKAALITGGLAPVTGSPERVYAATYARVATRNAEYFANYPQDRAAVTAIARHLDAVPEYLPTGERLSTRRFQMTGSYLGGNTRFDALHFLLEDAFMETTDGRRLTDAFLEQVGTLVSRASNCLYAVLHESIYCQGEASNWAADRVLEQYPQFRPDAAEPLLFGEMIYPWYFEEDPALVGMRKTAGILAQRSDWPALYDLDQLAANTVPAAAAVYLDDIYVDHDLSLETAGRVQGLQVWETGDFHHDGITDDGEAILARLLTMVEEP